MYGKHIVGLDWDDVEAIGVKGADASSTVAGYGWNVVKVLFKGKGFPLEGMLDGFSINAGGVETDTGAYPNRVGSPASKSVNVSDGINVLGGVTKCGSNMLGADEGNGAIGEAGGGKDCEGVRGREPKVNPALGDTD